jgi:uncharacterized protein (TIGR03083 family)
MAQTEIVIIERQVDCGQIYRQKRRELMALLGSLTEEQRRREVPATPAWSVHDVLAHLVGITTDLNAGRFGAGDLDAWTAEQVRMRSGRPIEELGDEWDVEGPKFEEGLRLLGYEIGSHYVGDLLQHAQDISAALGMQRIAEGEALVVALDFYLDALHQRLVAAGVGSLAVRVDDEEWALGSGPVVATLMGSRFEVFRSLGGRRSEAQVRALSWTGDVDAMVRVLSAYPMPHGAIVDT